MCVCPLCVWLFLWDSPCLCQVSAVGCANKEMHFSLSSVLAICNFCALLLRWGGCSELCAVALLFPSCRAEQHLPAES